MVRPQRAVRIRRAWPRSTNRLTSDSPSKKSSAGGITRDSILFFHARRRHAVQTADGEAERRSDAQQRGNGGLAERQVRSGRTYPFAIRQGCLRDGAARDSGRTPHVESRAKPRSANRQNRASLRNGTSAISDDFRASHQSEPDRLARDTISTPLCQFETA